MKKSLQAIIKAYQKCVSPFLGARCRFYPSCSHYALDCLNKYPASRALKKILSRLARCQPWNRGGYDPA